MSAALAQIQTPFHQASTDIARQTMREEQATKRLPGCKKLQGGNVYSLKGTAPSELLQNAIDALNMKVDIHLGSTDNSSNLDMALAFTEQVEKMAGQLKFDQAQLFDSVETTPGQFYARLGKAVFKRAALQAEPADARADVLLAADLFAKGGIGARQGFEISGVPQERVHRGVAEMFLSQMYYEIHNNGDPQAAFQAAETAFSLLGGLDVPRAAALKELDTSEQSIYRDLMEFHLGKEDYTPDPAQIKDFVYKAGGKIGNGISIDFGKGGNFTAVLQAMAETVRENTHLATPAQEELFKDIHARGKILDGGCMEMLYHNAINKGRIRDNFNDLLVQLDLRMQERMKESEWHFDRLSRKTGAAVRRSFEDPREEQMRQMWKAGRQRRIGTGYPIGPLP